MPKWHGMLMMGYLKHNLEEVTPKSSNFLSSIHFTVTRTSDRMVICTFPCWSNDICAAICTGSYQIRSISTGLVSILIASIDWKQRAKLKMKKVSAKSASKYLQRESISTTICFRSIPQKRKLKLAFISVKRETYHAAVYFSKRKYWFFSHKWHTPKYKVTSKNVHL